jgi:tetratricopeptide (TPR) repeat protein
MDRTRELEAELRRRAAQQPPGRYPVQHATICFHLGTVLTGSGRFDEAEEVLARAAELFGPHLPVEQAKSQNGLGTAQRAAGRLDRAATNFRRAAETLAARDQRLEAGAAWFNLGLVERERGRGRAAVEALRAARELLDEERAAGAAASAARELGTALLEQGELDPARTELERSLELARRVGDHAGVGLAANVLGLVELAAGADAAAVIAFGTAAAAHPPNVRREGHAIATANLGLALERLGRTAEARLAARQARWLASDGPVHDQASALLTRLGDEPGDLARVLSREPEERWPELVRTELTRWAQLPGAERRSEADAWIAAQVGAPDVIERAVALVGGLLELPPADLEPVVDGLLDAWVDRAEEEREAFRDQLARAVVRFHIPQWMRLRAVLEAGARARGDGGPWG